MTNTKALILSACFAWTLVAVSASSRANAAMLTLPTSYSYANCNQVWGYSSNVPCDYAYPYWQNIKFLSTSCSSGGCSGTGPAPWVSAIASGGRKQVRREAASRCMPKGTA
jgi:hypothetical protein